jgi:primary-amine oxidase
LLSYSNFQNERIIYELSPQEAMAQYSGSDPHQSATAWLDRAFGMGGNVREVIVGYDCPEHATFFDAMVHEGGTSVRRKAICVFERDKGTPLSRHFGTSEDEMGAVKAYELVVRSISTVGNYDYIVSTPFWGLRVLIAKFDYTFQLDGTIEIRVSASGYLQGGLWDDSQDPYGHRIQMQSMGSLHDHVINCELIRTRYPYKADA